jgi:hypothetical protein
MSIGAGADGEGNDLALVAPDVDPRRLADYELVADMRELQTMQAVMYAGDLEAVARWAARRHTGLVLGTAGGRGGPGVDTRALADLALSGIDEDFVSELALARGCAESHASVVLREALLLTGPLSPTWCRLNAGLLSVPHAKAVVDLLGDAAPEVAAAVQARVLPRSEDSTAAAFRDRIRYHLYRVDAEAKERRRREALHRADVFTRRLDDGISELVIQGPTPAVHAAASAIDQLAGFRRADGDTRPMGVLRAETGLDLLLRPWDTTRPTVTGKLVIHAAARALRGDSDPGLIDGVVVSAAECREAVDELDQLDLLVAFDHPRTGETIAVATEKELRRAARGPGLRPPPDTDAYEPTAAQKRFLDVRDRHCRMPGCRRRPGRLDLDHGDAHADGGPTACWNLCCLCRRHHRIKTHAPGWFFRLLAGGTLEVRTPAGVTRTTRPPGWWPDPEPDPPWLDETAPPDLLRI